MSLIKFPISDHRGLSLEDVIHDIAKDHITTVLVGKNQSLNHILNSPEWSRFVSVTKRVILDRAAKDALWRKSEFLTSFIRGAVSRYSLQKLEKVAKKLNGLRAIR